MDDATFLRNLARRSRVVLLADGTALPVPTSVMDDPNLAGATFRINLISPEGAESGDRRTFVPGTTEHRDLPLPLLWQWQLADGHKNAVVVGRIDHIERTAQGLGNARGVFDTGPWGREAERMVRAGMVRGVSGDYSSFSAKVLEKADPEEQRIIDDKISVDRSKLVAATIVAKPAFEDCYIEILDDDQVLPNGIIEAPIAVTAAALRLVRPELVARLERLEQLEADQLALIASATAERVSALRMQHDRDAAVARIRSLRNLTAAWKPMPHDWLSAKAKLQPRDALGRWIEIGSTVRWRHGAGSSKSSKIGKAKGPSHMPGVPYHQGKVKSFDAKTGLYDIEPLDGSPSVKLQGADVEVVKAVIPSSPDEAQKITQGLDAATQSLIHGTNEKLGLPDAPHPDAPPANAPTLDPEAAIQAGEARKNALNDSISAAKSDDPKIKEVGLDRLSELMGAQIEPGDVPFQTNREIAKADKRDAKLAETADQWPDRETLGRQLFNNLQAPGETWEKDGEKYQRAGDKLRLLSESRLLSSKRRQWIKDTYGKGADPIPDRQTAKDQAWSDTFNPPETNAPEVNAPDATPTAEEQEIAPLAAKLNDLWGPADTPAPSAEVDLWKAAKDDTPAPAKNDAVQKIGGDIVKAQQEKNAPKDDPLAAHDNALAEGNQWGDKPKTTVPQFGSNQPTKTVSGPPADPPKPPADGPTASPEPSDDGTAELTSYMSDLGMPDGYLSDEIAKLRETPAADENEQRKRLEAAFAKDVADTEHNITGEEQKDVRDMIGRLDHLGVKDEPAAPDAPSDPVAAAADDFAKAVHDAGLEGFDEHIDEVKNAGDAGRSPGQFDSIEEKIDENVDSMTDSEETAIRSAFENMKKTALDAPGETTIADLEKPTPKTALPDDLPDQSADALTVPADWEKGQNLDDAFGAPPEGAKLNPEALPEPGQPVPNEKLGLSDTRDPRQTTYKKPGDLKVGDVIMAQSGSNGMRITSVLKGQGYDNGDDLIQGEDLSTGKLTNLNISYQNKNHDLPVAVNPDLIKNKHDNLWPGQEVLARNLFDQFGHGDWNAEKDKFLADAADLRKYEYEPSGKALAHEVMKKYAPDTQGWSYPTEVEWTEKANRALHGNPVYKGGDYYPLSAAIERALPGEEWRASDFARMLPFEAPTGNVTEMAKAMYESSTKSGRSLGIVKDNWDTTNQDEWLDRARKIQKELGL